MNKLSFLFFILLFSNSYSSANNTLPQLYDQLVLAQQDSTKVRILIEICHLHTNTDSLLQYADKALAIVDTTNYRNQYADILGFHCLVWFRKQNLDKSIYYAQRGLKISLEQKNFKDAGMTANRIGICFRVKNDYLLALSYFRISIQHYLQAGDSTELSAPYIGIGNIYYSTSHLDSALHYYEQAFRFAEHSSIHQAFAATALTNMGNIYLSYAKDYETALSYQFKGLARAQKTKKFKEIITAFNTIGATYLTANQPDSAIVYFQKALDHNDNIHTHSLFYSLENLGLAYKNKNNIVLAKWYYRQVLQRWPNHPDIYVTFGNIGSLFAQENRLDSALWYLEQAKKIMLQKKDIRYKQEIYASLAEIYQRNGQPQQAFQNLQQAYITKDTLFNEQRTKIIEQAKTRNRLDSVTILSKELNERELELENEKIQVQAERLKTIISSFIALFLFGSGLATFWYYWQEKKQKQQINQELNNLMQQFTKQETLTEYPLTLQNSLVVKSLNSNDKLWIPFEDIVYLKAEGKSALVVTSKNKRYWSSAGLKKLMCEQGEIGNNINFARVHKSYLINLNLVISIRPRSENKKKQEIILNSSPAETEGIPNELPIPLGEAYKKEFTKKFKLFIQLTRKEN